MILWQIYSGNCVTNFIRIAQVLYKILQKKSILVSFLDTVYMVVYPVVKVRRGTLELTFIFPAEFQSSVTVFVYQRAGDYLTTRHQTRKARSKDVGIERR